MKPPKSNNKTIAPRPLDIAGRERDRIISAPARKVNGAGGRSAVELVLGVDDVPPVQVAPVHAQHQHLRRGHVGGEGMLFWSHSREMYSSSFSREGSLGSTKNSTMSISL